MNFIFERNKIFSDASKFLNHREREIVKALRQFVRSTDWEDERGTTVSREIKRQWLNNLDNISDLAGISYCPHYDYVGLWYTNFDPFSEKGLWIIIPGIRRCIREIERTERRANRRN